MIDWCLTGSGRRSMSLATPSGRALFIISARMSLMTSANHPPSQFFILHFSFSLFQSTFFSFDVFEQISGVSEFNLWFFDLIKYQSPSNRITKYTKPSKIQHLWKWCSVKTFKLAIQSVKTVPSLVKINFRHADGGFESVPMTDAEENGHPSKWDNGVRILVTTLHLSRKEINFQRHFNI